MASSGEKTETVTVIGGRSPFDFEFDSVESIAGSDVDPTGDFDRMTDSDPDSEHLSNSTRGYGNGNSTSVSVSSDDEEESVHSGPSITLSCGSSIRLPPPQLTLALVPVPVQAPPPPPSWPVSNGFQKPKRPDARGRGKFTVAARQSNQLLSPIVPSAPPPPSIGTAATSSKGEGLVLGCKRPAGVGRGRGRGQRVNEGSSLRDTTNPFESPQTIKKYKSNPIQNQMSQPLRLRLPPQRNGTGNGQLNLSPELQEQFDQEQRGVQWISYQSSEMTDTESAGDAHAIQITLDSLLLKRKLIHATVHKEPNFISTDFCPPELIHKLRDAKHMFGGYSEEEEFINFREKLNQFASVEEMKFVHRNALLIANIDASLNWELSNPRDSRGETLLKPNELLYFVDVYGERGGAAEYLLWKKQWHAHGLGFTSKDPTYDCDWDLPSKPYYPHESFDAHYGFYNREGLGDLCDPKLVDTFIKYVRKVTAGRGAHICIAQGGHLLPRDEERTEFRWKCLFLSEVFVGLSTVRQGGHFVIKMFDMLTSFTVGLVYLLYRSFESVSIYKPESSSVATAERFVLCKHRKGGNEVDGVSKFLSDCLNLFHGSQRSRDKRNTTVVAHIKELIPMTEIKRDKVFCNYILGVNIGLGRLQLSHMDQLHKCLLQSRYDSQSEVDIASTAIESHFVKTILEKAWTFWGIPKDLSPNGLKKFSVKDTPDDRSRKLMGGLHSVGVLDSILKEGEQILDYESMTEELTGIQEASWHFVLVGRGRGFFLSLGGERVYEYIGSNNRDVNGLRRPKPWQKLAERVELCENTLVYADLVEETQIFENQQIVRVGFHIIDGLFLGGKDIRNLPFLERWELCGKFARSMHKPARNDIAAVRVKDQLPLNKLRSCLTRKHKENLLGGHGSSSQQITWPVHPPGRRPGGRNSDKRFKPTGLSMFRTRKGGGVHGDYIFCLQNRLFWRFAEDVNLDPESESKSKDLKDDAENESRPYPLHAVTLINFLKGT